jgi:hypothetical protein
MRSFAGLDAAQINLAASLITLGLAADSRPARWVYRFAAEHPRVPALVAAAAVAVATVLEWGRAAVQMILLQQDSNMFHFVGLIMRAGPGVGAAGMLLAAAWTAYRLPWLGGVSGAGGAFWLWSGACLYARGAAAPAWGLAVVFAAPVVLGVAYALALLGRHSAGEARAAV